MSSLLHASESQDSGESAQIKISQSRICKRMLSHQRCPPVRVWSCQVSIPTAWRSWIRWVTTSWFVRLKLTNPRFICFLPDRRKTPAAATTADDAALVVYFSSTGRIHPIGLEGFSGQGQYPAGSAEVRERLRSPIR